MKRLFLLCMMQICTNISHECLSHLSMKLHKRFCYIRMIPQSCDKKTIYKYMMKDVMFKYCGNWLLASLPC